MSAATARSSRATTAVPEKKVPSTPRPELRVLPPQPFRAPRGPFALLVGAVLTFGLLGVLVLNTVVAQDAFTLSALQAKSAALADEEQALTQQVAAADSPQRLESRARSLGMVPNVNPAFVRLADGKILGEPVAAKAPVVRTVTTTTTAGNATTPNTTATTAPTARSLPGNGDGAGASSVLKTKAAAPRTKAAQANR